MNATKKRLKFKTLLLSKPLILIGVHDPLSAKLVELSGWHALWASSFGFSTVAGIADANLLTFTENLETLRKIVRCTKIPLIADCDNGYGDLAILNRVVNEYESAGITGICIEDNIFPKRCSFYDKGSSPKLISIEEHTAKIKLATRKRHDKKFFVIARTESFIAGLGVREALKRASAYAQAGADAICVHSRRSDENEIREFARLWDKPTPLIAIPTTYYKVSPSDLYKAGYKVVIFANQLLRNSIQSMQSFLKHIQDEEKRLEVFSQNIVSLEEIFNLTDVQEIKKLEKEFFS